MGQHRGVPLVLASGMMWMSLAGWAASPPRVSTASKGAKKPKVQVSAQDLRKLTLISTRAAAKAAVRAKMAKVKSGAKASQVPAVSEFHAVSEPVVGDAPLRLSQKKRGPLRDVHGAVYGVNGAGQAGAGGAVGASSRSGKLNIFVGSEHAAVKSTSSH